MPHDEVYGEGRSPTNSDDGWIGTVLLCIHEEGECDAHDYATDKDEVEKVRLVGEGVTKIPEDGHGTAEVDWIFVSS